MKDLLDRIAQVPRNRHRRVIAIAGPPASGKSSLVKKLGAQIDGSSVLPMDGFHLDNSELDARGLRDRKGAPETFDADGFLALVRYLQSPGPILVPTFDRAKDAVISDSATIPANCHTVLVEGNYLLFDRPPWNQLHAEWDFSVYLDVPEKVLRKRLVNRWLKHGLSREDAVNRAENHDIPNAEIVVQVGFRADYSYPNL